MTYLPTRIWIRKLADWWLANGNKEINQDNMPPKPTKDIIEDIERKYYVDSGKSET